MTAVILMLLPNVDVQAADYRGLLTDREREILSGAEDVSQNRVYQIRHRVKEKTDRLAKDQGILEEHEPDLAGELRTVVLESLGSDLQNAA